MNRQTYNAPALRTGPLETGLALTGAWEAPVAVLRGTHTRPMDYVELQPRSWEGSDASCLLRCLSSTRARHRFRAPL